MPDQRAQTVICRSCGAPLSVCSRGSALSRPRRWLKSSFWVPGDVAANTEIDSAKGLDVTWWRVSLRAESHWHGASGHTHYRTVTRTRRNPATGRSEPYADSEPYKVWYPVSSRHFGQYDETIHASAGVSRQEMDAVGPWEHLEIEDVGPVDESRCLIETPSPGMEEATRPAREIVQAKERSACASLVDRLDGLATRFREVRTLRERLPVWVLEYRYGAKRRRALIDGHTGQVSGRRLVCWLKVGIAAGLVGLLSLAVAVGAYLLTRT